MMNSFQHGRVFVTVYDRSLPMFPECFWTRIYFLLKGNGLDQMFASGIDHDGFIAYFVAGRFPIVAGIETGDGGWEEVGISWLEPMIWTDQARVARIHVAIMPRWRTAKAALVAGLLGLKFCFERYGIQCLYGAFYGENLRARRYDEFLGFSEFHRLPRFSLRNGKLEDMIVGTLLREDFDFERKVGIVDGRRGKPEHSEPAATAIDGGSESGVYSRRPGTIPVQSNGSRAGAIGAVLSGFGLRKPAVDSSGHRSSVGSDSAADPEPGSEHHADCSGGRGEESGD